LSWRYSSVPIALESSTAPFRSAGIAERGSDGRPDRTFVADGAAHEPTTRTQANHALPLMTSGYRVRVACWMVELKPVREV